MLHGRPQFNEDGHDSGYSYRLMTMVSLGRLLVGFFLGLLDSFRAASSKMLPLVTIMAWPPNIEYRHNILLSKGVSTSAAGGYP